MININWNVMMDIISPERVIVYHECWSNLGNIADKLVFRYCDIGTPDMVQVGKVNQIPIKLNFPPSLITEVEENGPKLIARISPYVYLVKPLNI